MTSYAIYLTKSDEVARIIAKGLSTNGDILCIGHGCVDDDERIPVIYRDQDWFFALAEYKSAHPEYEIIFA